MNYTNVSDLLLEDVASKKISSASIPVYLYLKFNTNPSQAQMAKDLGSSIPSVQRHVSDLKKAGWVEAVRSNALFGANVYVVLDQPTRVA